MRLVALVLLLAVVGGGWVFYRLNQPYKGFSEPVFVEFARGTPTRVIATTLGEQRSDPGSLAVPCSARFASRVESAGR